MAGTIPSRGTELEQLIQDDATVSNVNILDLKARESHYDFAIVLSFSEEAVHSQTIPALVIRAAQNVLRRSSERTLSIPYCRCIWAVLESSPTNVQPNIDEHVIQTELDSRIRGTGTSTEEHINLIVSQVLNIAVSEVHASQSFIQLGGDSTTAVDVVSHCFTRGIILSPKDILGVSDLATLASIASIMLLVQDASIESENKHSSLRTPENIRSTNHSLFLPSGDTRANSLAPSPQHSWSGSQTESASSVDTSGHPDPSKPTAIHQTRYLAGSTPCIFPAIPGKSQDLEFMSQPLDIDIASIQSSCRSQSIAFATVLKAAWSIILQTYTSMDDVCFGFCTSRSDVTTSTPAQGETQDLDRVLVCRSIMSDFETLADILERLEGEHYSSSREDSSTMSTIHQTTLPNQQLFNTIVLIRSSNGSAEATAGTMPRTSAALEYDIVLRADINHGIMVDYHTSRLSESAGQRLARSIAKTIRCILLEPETPAAGFQVVCDQDIDLQPYKTLPSPTRSCTHFMIMEQVNSRPEIDAVVSWDRTLTYRELNNLATRVAGKLQSAGLRPQSYVGLCFSKSALAVVMMMAIQITGAAFVPLDPKAPTARWRNILESVDAKWAVCDAEFETKLEQCNLSTLVFSNDSLDEAQEPFVAAEAIVTPEDPCVVLFTSGSTGKPKGIVMEHQTLCSLSNGHAKELGVGPGTRVFNFSAYTFDAGVMDVLLTLIRGACVCIPSEYERLNDLAGSMNRLRANWALMTPTVAGLLQPFDVPHLQDLVLAGEVVSQALAARWRDRVRLWAVYGPTEVAICAITDKPGAEQPSVGRPVSSAFWVVDASNSRCLVPDGVVGELLIQGPLLARGYASADERVTANWITNPSNLPPNIPPAKAYLTGDLVRRAADGTFDYVGRKDSQIKLNGQRIELGEIGAQLSHCLSEDMDGFVDVLRDDSGKPETIAALLWYLKGPFTDRSSVEILQVLSEEQRNIMSGLEFSLRNVLPSYMVPRLFFFFQGRPEHTHSGKIDRRQLFAKAAAVSVAERRFFASQLVQRVEPSTQMELILRDLWVRTLHCSYEDIGKHDNFFRMGGDSVSAIRLVAAAYSVDVRITVADIIENPELADMALVARQGRAEEYMAVERFNMLPRGMAKITTLEEVRRQCGLNTTEIIEDVYPCSALQEGLMATTARKSGSYIERLVYRIESTNNVTAFRAAWERTVEACEILRTRIVLVADSIALQAVIKEEAAWDPLEGNRLRDISKSLDTFAVSYGSRLNQFALVKDNGVDYFVWAIHHALYDGWTLRNIFGVLNRIYCGAMTPTFGRYASFINYSLSLSQDFAADYWRSQLTGGRRAAFPLPLSSKNESSSTNGIYKTAISFVTQEATSFTRASVLQAAWAILLARYCDTDDICYGLTVSGRQAPIHRIDDIIGPTIATVPVRIRLDKDSLVSRYLDTVQRMSAERVPFEQYGLQNISKLSHDASETCSFSTLLVLQPADIINVGDESHGGVLRAGRAERDFTERTMGDYFEYPLVLQALVQVNTVHLTFMYDAEYLTVSQCVAMSKQLEHISQQLLAPEDKLIGSITVAGEWDLQQAVKLNALEAEPAQSCLHDLISVKIQQHPDREAIYSRGGSLSYGEIAKAAEHVAAYVVSSGILEGSIIPICFKSSPWAIVAMLGVLKAGCAFMPLDPSHPEDRRRWLANEVHAQLIIASSTTAELCQGMASQVLTLSQQFIVSGSSSAYDGELANRASTPADIAYVLFTSGSTGKPKGVMVQHSAICSSIEAYAAKHKVESSIRAMQFSNYAFDASIYEIFMTLACGGTVCVPQESERLENTVTFMKQARVTYAMLTPSFVKTLDLDSVQTLNTLMLIGEAPTLDVVDRWKSRVTVINGYGPTETCVICQSYVFPPEETFTVSTTIGSNVHGSSWIVEPENHNQLAPIGCVGELVINSVALALGYYNDVEKTTASFLDDVAWLPTSSPARRGRFYKTGDLVRYNPDGTIEYLGRKDTQVKLRGQRLELGEIEYNLQTSTSWIQNTAVHLTKRPNGDFLVAFIEPDRTVLKTLSTVMEISSSILELDEEVTSYLVDLKSKLKSTLPPYMVPSFFIPLGEIPLGTTMKTDRKQLQELADRLSLEELGRYSLSTSFRAEPETRNEVVLRELWAQILSMPAEQISRHDSFLLIGGDSISAIHLSSLARKRGLEIPVSVIFQDARLSSMAQAAVNCDASTNLVDISPVPFSLLDSKDVDDVAAQIRVHCKLATHEIIQDAYPCTPLQEGLLALSVRYPGSYIAKHVYRLNQDIDLARFQSAWEHVYDICDNQRQRIVKLGDASIQVLVGGDFVWEPTERINLREYLEIAQNMTMSYGSKLCRSAIVQESTGEKYFVWVNHHAVFDGWTVTLILNALKETYNAVEVTPFVPYSSFIKYSSSLDMAQARDYWKRQLHGALPSDFPPATSTNRLYTNGSKKVTRLITRRIPFPSSTRTSITKGTILRAAWAIVLARYGNTDDVCFGATASGRNATVPGIERMAGTVIGTVPVRIRIDPKDSIKSFLDGIQTQALDMVPYEQTGFQNIQRIDAGTRLAADVTSLLIVQPERQVDMMANAASAFMTRASDEEYSVDDTMEGYFTFPIVLQCPIYNDHVILDFTYDSSVVHEPQMEALCRHLENVVHQLLAQDDKPVRDVGLTGEWDLQQALYFNRHVTETIVDTCIQDLVLRWALESPDHEAIYTSDASLSYAQLDKFSTLLACHLSQIGVSLEVVVPICMEKSVWMAVAILGIVKAGGVFMPMDPTHPYERRKALIEQVNARYVVTTDDSAPSCKLLADHTVLLSNSFFERLSENTKPATSLPKVSPTNAAYILFTSGSTGQPKGILVEHTAICSSISSHGKEFNLNCSSRVLQFASYVFDVSMSELLSTLAFGGTVCVPTGAERLQDIVGFINKSRVDTAMLTPSFVSTFSPDQVPGLRTLVLGGEAPTKQTLAVWQSHLRLLNGYAPAECCIYALTYTYKTVDDAPTLLGKGLHVNCWIVDPEDHNKLAPIGCVGELVIQGNTIGRGYIQDDKRTEKVFLDSISWMPQEWHKERYRFYKSGDLVKYDIHGNIDYLGRKDTQVKLRGQRIELGEIEYNIQQILEEAEYVTVEVVRKDSREALIVFVTFPATEDEREEDGKITRDVEDLIRPMSAPLKTRFELLVHELSTRLPSYMVPSLFMPLYRMPFLSSMKVDRRRLRRLVDNLSHEQYSGLALAKSEKQAPMNENEASMRKLWAKVLALDSSQIGRDDSFFHLGGDSISSIELVSLARQNGLELTVASIFKDSRLSEVAASALVCQDENILSTEAFSLLSEEPSDYTFHEIRQQCDLNHTELIEDVYPCTKLQEGLMALSIQNPGSYVANYSFELGNDVDVNSFKLAWEWTVNMSAIMRTRILILNGEIVQAVIKANLAWESTESETVESYIARTSRINMAYGTPLSRYALLSDRHFVWTVHHAVSDGWTMQVILDRLDKTYRRVETPEVGFFASFIKYTLDLDKDAARQYWDDQLDGAKRASFPEGPSETQKTTEKYTKSLAFEKPREMATTTATILRAAWTIIMAKYCDSNDVCFGTTVSGRQAPVVGLNNIAGPMIATVPIRVKLDYDQPIDDFLLGVQEQALSLAAYEQFGLQNIAKVNESARLACDFSSLFVVQPMQFTGGVERHNTVLDYKGANEYDRADSDHSYYTYPLVVQLKVYSSEIEFDISYAPSTISAARIETLVFHFEHVLSQLLQNGNRPLRDISVAGPWDLEKAIGWNTEDISPVDACVQEFFAKQVAEVPQKEALYSTSRSISYLELDRLTTQLAVHLKRLGVGPETIVPYCFEKSIWAVVSVFAILKAGGAFMPLDAAHPLEYRQGLVKQVHAEIVLVSPETASRCQNLTKTIVLVCASSSFFKDIDSDAEEMLKHDPPAPNNPAYVIFSSGSTGTPKGIVVEHRAFSASLLGQSRRLGFRRESRVLQFSNYVFDVSCSDIITTLACGGTLCIPSNDERLQDTAQFVSRAQCNMGLIIPSFLRTITPEQVPTLKTLMVGGEAVAPDTVAVWADKTTLVNSYGVAESSVYSTSYVYKSSRDVAATIGRGFACATWVVDADYPDRLAPVGCIGELVLQSPTLARGYLNDPERTARSFKHEARFLPQSEIRKSPRFYHTGDLVRYNDHGELLYIGRRDAQVKLRGQRIELGDIEYKLMQASSLIEHVVVDVLRQGSSEYLIAFASFRAEGGAKAQQGTNFRSGADLRRRFFTDLSIKVADILPGHMVPTYYLPVEAMPYTSSGKIDRKALKEHAASLSTQELLLCSVSDRSAFRDCENETESRIRALWARVLNLEETKISIDDNFYDIGGDSIRIITVVKYLQKEFAVFVGLSMFNSRSTTIANMAQLVASRTSEVSKVDLFNDIVSAVDSPWATLIDTAGFCSVTTLPQNAVVFLTGATGFLGTQLLRQLLACPNVGRVVVLVRAASVERGLARVKYVASLAQWWKEDIASRIEVWTGDLASVQLGLSGQQWDSICGRSVKGSIDAIIHNGAVVNWNADYERLYKPNVQSVIELLKAAVESRTVPKFIYISGGAKTDPDADRQQVATDMVNNIGYNQSKFVAESIVYDIASRLPRHQNRFSIVKPGMIIGTAQEGVANIDDFLWRVVATAAQLQSYPLEPGDNYVAMTDAGFVANSTLNQLLSDRIMSFEDLSATCGLRTSQFWTLVNSELQFACEPVPWVTWIDKAVQHMNHVGETHPLWPVQHFLEDDGGISTNEKLAVPDEKSLHAAVKKNVRYLIDVGFVSSDPQAFDPLQEDVIRR